MALPAVMAGIAIAGAVASAVSKAKQLSSEAQALRNKEALAYLQANEMQRRADFNINLLGTKINRQNKEFLASYASTGGASAKTQESVDTVLLENMSSELERARLESEYEINMKKMEAQGYGQASGAANSMVPWTILTGGLQTASSAYSMNK